MKVLDNDVFLSSLGTLLKKASENGTFYLKLKRIYGPEIADEGDKQLYSGRVGSNRHHSAVDFDPDRDDRELGVTEYRLLVRAVCGKVKLATVVEKKRIVKFMDSYKNICTLGMHPAEKIAVQV